MAKQYEFKASLLPYLLVLPQMIIVFIFFFWPSAQAILQSFYLQDPFGGRMIFVGFENYSKLLNDPDYWHSLWVSSAFAASITVSSMALALLLAVQANKKIRLASFYKTMLIWPYAVSTLVAGVIWLFMFNPNVGVIAYMLKHTFNVDWQYLLHFDQAFLLLTMAASWKQIAYNFVFFSPVYRACPQRL